MGGTIECTRRRVKSRRAQESQSRRRRRLAHTSLALVMRRSCGLPADAEQVRRARPGYSPRNLVGTREVDSTSCFDAFTYLTMVGMWPLVSFSFPCMSALVGSISFRITCFHCA